MDAFNQADPRFEQDVRDRVGDRLKCIPAAASDAFEATEDVPEWLEDDHIKGVVILGDYTTVPPRRMQCMEPDLLYQLIDSDCRLGNDWDDWWVWNDDLYASRSPNGIADLPVSRLPIIPKQVSSPFKSDTLVSATCIWGTEFPVVDRIFFGYLPAEGHQLESPPFAAKARDYRAYKQITDEHLAADKVYLMVHGEARVTILNWGSQAGSWKPVAVDGSLFVDDWSLDGVVFAGACWGVQLADLTAYEAEPDVHFESLAIEASLPLEFINRGANAFVGFTALHHVPIGRTELVLGAPLHDMFWKNIASGEMAPAEALFQAKAGYVSAMQADGMHKLALAQELKALWAASCIGLGW